MGFRLTQIWRPGTTVQCAELQGTGRGIVPLLPLNRVTLASGKAGSNVPAAAAFFNPQFKARFNGKGIEGWWI